MTAVDWSALAHRAVTAATLHSVAPRSPRVVCGASEQQGNIVVRVDDPSLDAAAFAAVRSALPASDGVLAIVVASTSASALVRAGLRDASGTDAFARAVAWSICAAQAPLAPAVTPGRLRELVAHAEASGLALVEPDLPGPRVAHARTAVERAIASVVMFGATARPLLFVPTARAPKGGLLKTRVERALDGWVEGRLPPSSLAPASLFDAALAVLARAPGPMRGKELLREARALWTKTSGAQAATGDGPTLAKALVLAWGDAAIELYARDPATRW